MLDIGYALSTRFPDPPQTDYRRADVRALRHDLFCGDVYLADTKADRELSTAWGWVPVLDFAWALCDIVERIDRDPVSSRASAPSGRNSTSPSPPTVCSSSAASGGWTSRPTGCRMEEPPLSFSHAELRREARDFLQDLIADLCDLHDDLAENPAIWTLQAKFPRVG